MIRIANRLENEFGGRPKIEEMYRDPTVRAIARMVGQSAGQEEVPAATGLVTSRMLEVFPLLKEPEQRTAVSVR
jgi:hypothetical protein